MFDLKGKTAIITGGNQGIGFAVAKGLASEGATVVIANRRTEDGLKAAASLTKEGLRAAAISTDITSEISLTNLIKQVTKDFGRIDVLINNAGVIIRKSAMEISENDWDYMMDINLKGLFFCCQAVSREMIKQGKGKIINISSDASFRAMDLRSVYCTSKAGVSHLTRCLAVEWAKYNINVNAIGPGPTITPLNKTYFDEHPEDLKKMIQSIPLNRMGAVSDYVGAAVFLASEASDFVTGQTLYVEGGSTIW